MKKDKSKSGRITEALKNSPINYFSDLFVVAMVIIWIVTIMYMTVIATIVTFAQNDLTLWEHIKDLVESPLTAGCALWMVKNCIQHSIANNRGKKADMDFPAVNAEGEEDGIEKPYGDDENESEVEP